MGGCAGKEVNEKRYVSRLERDQKSEGRTTRVLLQKINLESGNDRIFVFIDELQRKENAGVFLKGIYDGAKYFKFIVSGKHSRIEAFKYSRIS